MRTILAGICICIASITSWAQRECHTSEYILAQKAADPSFARRLEAAEQFIQSGRSEWRGAQSGEDVAARLIRIPVVVHVVYNNAAQNISEGQIKAQIEALNRDFRRRNADTLNTPLRFKNLGADVLIEFALATADPKGRPTNGIVRKSSNVTRWKGDDKIKFSAQGGSDAWDSRSYLNIWVGNMEGVIGYSSVPGSDATVDGIVLAHTVCGNNLGGAYSLGRTGVHEVGHWLGLRHIWGDDYCGDDLVHDTPKQGNFTPGCPTAFRTSCSNGTLGDMYMNYMDYTNDACMSLFTNGQAQRMRALFEAGGPRAALLESKGLNQPWTAPAPEVMELVVKPLPSRVYPNPVSSQLTIEVGEEFVGKTAFITNANGVTVSRVVVTTTKQTISLAHLPKGMYLLQMESGKTKIREKLIKL